MKSKSVKMTKQHIFIIENNLLQKVGQSFFHLSRKTTVMQDLLVRHQFSLLPVCIVTPKINNILLQCSLGLELTV